METLCYETLKRQGYQGYLLKDAPEKVLQFGEGGFLRAFAEDFIDRMNESAGFNGKVVLVQPRGGHPKTCEMFQKQDGLYTLLLRGQMNGKAVSASRVISCVSRCLDPLADWQTVLDCAKNPQLRFIISNTTEAAVMACPQFQDWLWIPHGYANRLVCTCAAFISRCSISSSIRSSLKYFSRPLCWL